VRWETEWLFDDQLCREYVYQKLLKLDSPSSSYGKKNFGEFFYASHCSGERRQHAAITCFDYLAND